MVNFINEYKRRNEIGMYMHIQAHSFSVHIMFILNSKMSLYIGKEEMSQGQSVKKKIKKRKNFSDFFSLSLSKRTRMITKKKKKKNVQAFLHNRLYTSDVDRMYLPFDRIIS